MTLDPQMPPSRTTYLSGPTHFRPRRPVGTLVRSLQDPQPDPRRVVESTGGAVELVKVNVDENPRISQSFQVHQSLPSSRSKTARSSIGSSCARWKLRSRDFVERLLPVPSETEQLTALGDEASLSSRTRARATFRAPSLAWQEILVGRGEPQEALDLLARIPDTGEARRVAALARLAIVGNARVSERRRPRRRRRAREANLDALLERAKADDEARQELVDILETMDSSDPRRAQYRRALASRLF